MATDWRTLLDRHPGIRHAPGASLVEGTLPLGADEDVAVLSAVGTAHGAALLVLTDKRLLLCSERGVLRRSLTIDYEAHIAHATDAEVRRMGADGGLFAMRLYTEKGESPIITFDDEQEVTHIFGYLELFVRAYGKPTG